MTKISVFRFLVLRFAIKGVGFSIEKKLLRRHFDCEML